MSKLANINNESCPKCHEKGVLFVCSMGAVNCSNCCEYIRSLTADEWDERQEIVKQIAGRYKNRSPLGQSLKNIRVFARITLREMANAMNVKAAYIVSILRTQTTSNNEVKHDNSIDKDSKRPD